MVKGSRSLCVIFSLAASVMTASAGAVRALSDFQPASLPKGDDVSTSPIPLGFRINFLGQSTDSVYVDTNGALTFHSAYVGYPGVPPENYAGGVILPMSSNPQAIICAFLSDIDTSRKAAGAISYGTITLNGRPAFAVTYSNVTYFSFSSEDFDTKRNSFQIVLVERSDTGAGNFDIELNYDRIQWESADSNGGKSGFGGYAAMVGYSNGTRAPGTFYELPGSRAPGSYADGTALSLTAGSQNSATPGRYIFEIRNTVAPGASTPTSAPTPSGVFVNTDTTTQGNWQSFYGAGGYYIANSASKPPSYAVLTMTGNSVQTWAGGTTDPRALLINGGIASCFCSSNYLNSGFTIEIDMPGADGQRRQVALYLLDWDSNDRNETVKLVDAGSGAVLDTRTISSFHDGRYLVYNISGDVRIFVTTNSSRLNAVVSGVFFGQ